MKNDKKEISGERVRQGPQEKCEKRNVGALDKPTQQDK